MTSRSDCPGSPATTRLATKMTLTRVQFGSVCPGTPDVGIVSPGPPGIEVEPLGVGFASPRLVDCGEAFHDVDAVPVWHVPTAG